MNSTEKKLDALIDALGFDVETERLVMKSKQQAHVNPLNHKMEYHDLEQVIITGYKLTKRVEKTSYACTKCGTHIGKGNSIHSCLCKDSRNVVKVDDETL